MYYFKVKDMIMVQLKQSPYIHINDEYMKWLTGCKMQNVKSMASGFSKK